jgi:RHS repeat-associated protein
MNRKTNVVSRFQDQTSTNASLNRSIEYSYASQDTANDVQDSNGNVIKDFYSPRVTVEKLLGQVIRREYLVVASSWRKTTHCQSDIASENLIATTKYYTTGTNTGRIQSMEYPDGTMELHDYAFDSTQRTDTVKRGQPNTAKDDIVDGTKTVTVVGTVGEMISRTVYDMASPTKILSRMMYSNYDDFRRPQTITYLDNATEQITYACCGVASFTSRDGISTSYTYDEYLKKPIQTMTSVNATECYSLIATLDSAGNASSVTRVGTNQNNILQRQMAYDTAGRLTNEINALGGATKYAYTATSKTTTYPDNGTRIEIYYGDGSLKSVTGTASKPVRYEYGWDSNGAFTKEIKLNNAYAATSEWTTTYADMMGRPFKTVYSAASGQPFRQSYYFSNGQLKSNIDPDNVATLYQYNAKGELQFTATDLNGNGMIDLSGPDRVTKTERYVTTGHGTDVVCIDTYAYLGTDSTATKLSSVETALNGLTTWQTTWKDGTAAVTTSQTAYSGATRTVTVTAPDQTRTVSVYRYGRLESVTKTDVNGSALTQTSYGYDPHSRVGTVTDLRTSAYTTAYGYNDGDQVVSVTTPAPATGIAAQTTTTYYDTSFRTYRTDYADGTTVTNQYNTLGLLIKTYGSRTYPTEYTYDAQGRMTTMKTWQSAILASGPATTTWNYNAYRNWIDNKRYNDNTGPAYTYTPGGRLKTRAWARNITATYNYGTIANVNNGDLVLVDYDDSTPDVTYTYDRLGRIKTTVRNGITDTLSYNTASELTGEACSGGMLAGFSVLNAYDSQLRRSSTEAKYSGTVLAHFDYGYDATTGRFKTANYGTAGAVYSYEPNSPLVNQITYTNSAAARLTSTKQFDRINRTISVQNTANGATVASYGYQYNQANQRTNLALADNSQWRYGYDSMGQVTVGKRYWSDGVAVAGQQYEYFYDDIGNRRTASFGGNPLGNDLRTSAYTADLLNGYTSRSVPGSVDVIGEASASVKVSVNSQPTIRHGEYYRGNPEAINNAGPKYQSITNTAVLNNAASDTVTNTVGYVLVPKAYQTFQYDADGNLTNDGIWSYVWDGENCLTSMSMTNITDIPDTARKKLDFQYDWMGRRIAKSISTWSSGAFGSTTTTCYLYDGWNLIAELNGATLKRGYLWGLDLSGGKQGAGGVGGLLALYDSTTASTHFAGYDANGNVSVLIKASDGSTTARYEYGPFGEIIRAMGPMAKTNPFRFSTKYTDDETDLVYYGYRYYSPSMGRWLSRDPIGENGGVNVYAMLGNDCLNASDNLGLKPVCCSNTKPVDITVASHDAPRAKESDKLPKNANVAQFLEHIANSVKSGECLRHLTIVSHGRPGAIGIAGNDADRSPPIRTGHVNQDNSIADYNAEKVGERLKNLVCMCKGSTIYILSCHVGLGNIGQELANGAGSNVYAPNGFCYPDVNNPLESPIKATSPRYPGPEYQYPGAGNSFIRFRHN